ncbi:phosphatidylinositol phosphate synthase [Microlunatus antarcticus]|uniref:Phosphatidylinositol phosphate synthase n=1 Tax=Microlunatus antarcticus TaxID=53388 RepID=A0A7W5JV16_9ACTN|nr:CDP-alcohol phosphatidyltransferase family protein [Microlunatus antarcticus]MBB3326789.1 CDP-diacylglycerol--glycerol-3-phosphate 3-phosphatidyltransferase [Microlunatus antarcticus]
MLERFRALSHLVLGPVARWLIRHGVSPDVVTVAGTAGVVLGALICFPQGWLWQGVLIVTVFVVSDMIDGLMAKTTGTASPWGAFLDSTSDRLGDAAVFGGILLFFAYRQDSTLWAAVALAGLVFGQWTSYVKARAESLGFTCGGGLAARADRLVIVLVGAFLAGLGVPYVLEAAMALLAVTSMITVFQRIEQVRRQAKGPRGAQDSHGPGAAHGQPV